MEETLDPEIYLKEVPLELLPEAVAHDGVSGEKLSRRESDQTQAPSDVSHFFDLRTLSKAYRSGELTQADYLSKRRDLINAFQACLADTTIGVGAPITTSVLLNALDSRSSTPAHRPNDEKPTIKQNYSAVWANDAQATTSTGASGTQGEFNSEKISDNPRQALLGSLSMSEVFERAAEIGEVSQGSTDSETGKVEDEGAPNTSSLDAAGLSCLPLELPEIEPNQQSVRYSDRSVSKALLTQNQLSTQNVPGPQHQRALMAKRTPEHHSWPEQLNNISWRSLAILSLFVASAASAASAAWMMGWLLDF